MPPARQVIRVQTKTNGRLALTRIDCRTRATHWRTDDLRQVRSQSLRASVQTGNPPRAKLAWQAHTSTSQLLATSAVCLSVNCSIHAGTCTAGERFKYTFAHANNTANNKRWRQFTAASDDAYPSVVLMGGSDPRLRQFKFSFTKTLAKFYTMRKIHNEKIYDILCKSQACKKTEDKGRFPAYR